MSMGFMVAMAGRKRDERGRYMDGNQGNRMDGGYEHPMGNYARMYDEPEMRRRRDSRGRYMEDDGGARMEYDGNRGNYGRMEQGGTSSHYWPGPHMPPYGDGAEMRRRRDSRGRYMEGGASAHYMPWPEPHIPPYLNDPEMREERRMESVGGHEMLDGQNPYGGEPKVYRRQREESRSDMRRMNEGKTSGGEVNYNRPDGGYGNVRYLMHKADPLNQHDGKEQIENMERPQQIGFQQNDLEDGLDKQTVMEWVENMEDSEGVKGAKYTWHQAQQYAMNKGITGQQRQLEFYWAMNAMYSDFHEAGKKFGVDKPDFYACLAKLFIEDPDAVEDKVEMYQKHIVKHDK